MPFRTILGHRRLLSLLSRSIARGTLPSSLIFAGPDGVGKKRAAVAVAQAFNCLTAGARGQGLGARGRDRGSGIGESEHEDGADFPVDGCGACAACRRIEKGAFTDVLFVEPGDSGSIKIEQVREAVAETAFRPFEGRRRVIIIDSADRMTDDAQDSLLKSIEEPPALSVFILVSARADTLAPTVRSRCSRLRFGRLSAAEIAQVLVRDHELGGEQARAMAALAEGSVGRALDVADGAVGDRQDAVCRALGRIGETTDARKRLAAARDLAGGSGTGASAGADREELTARLTVLASVIRDLAVLSTRADGSGLANLGLTSELQSLARFYGCERTVGAFLAADRALSALRRNASPKIVADWLALQL